MRVPVLFLLGFVVLRCVCGAEQPVVDEAPRKIWEAEIRNKPAGRVLDNWELTEGLMLCKEAGPLDNRLAAFATVAFHDEPRSGIKDLAIREKGLVAMAQDIKGTALSEGEQEQVKKLFARTVEGYGKRSTMPFYGTFHMGAALSLQQTIKDTKGIRDAVDKIHRVHGWVATVEDDADLPFEKYKEGIDKSIPIILEKDKRYTVAVGYVVVGDNKKYLVVADLAKTPLEKSGMLFTAKEREGFESLPPDHPERIYYEREKNTKDLVVDYTVSSSKALPAGVTVEEFEKSKYRAIFVHGWHESVEAWRPDVEEIVGKSKASKENAK